MDSKIVDIGGIELCYDAFGSDADPAVLLIAGLGAQLNFWPESLCHMLVQEGFRVVRFDNRDVGLSSKFTDDDADYRERFAAASRGDPVEVAYTIGDLAADAVGLLDALDIESAHLVGASMGGSIAQQVAISHPGRVRTLTCVMASTGERDYGQSRPEAMRALLQSPGRTRNEIIETGVNLRRHIAGAGFDEERTRTMLAEAYDRCWYPPGVRRHLLAAVASGDRADGLRRVAAPTLVVHGDADPLVDISGGRRLSELVCGSELLILAGMGHDIAERNLPPIVEAFLTVVRRFGDQPAT